MNSIKRTLAIIVAVALAATATMAKTPTIIKSADRHAMERWVNATFSAMTLDERIGQLIVVAVAPLDNESTTARLREMVQQRHVGGIIYSESDIATMATVNNRAQAMARVPLLVTMDFEWGLSMRLSDAPVFKRNLFLGAIDDDKLFYDYGREVARECRLMGVHVNFAPVLDVIDRDNTVVATRAFGGDPELVARHGIAFSKGLEDGGVLAVGKHFPGHGPTTVDSHKALPTIDKSWREYKLYDLLPFEKYIDAGLGGMLVAHLNVPAIDASGKPSSLSAKCVDDLLRQQLGFDGLCFTDALDMQGAKAVPGSTVVNALLAGNDVLLMPTSVEKAIEEVKAALADGTLTQKMVDDRCKKILRYKYALGLATGDRQVDVTTVAAKVNTPQAQLLARKMTAATITVVKNEQNALPIGDVSRGVTVMGAEGCAAFAGRCASYAAPRRDLARDCPAIVLVSDPAGVAQAKQQVASHGNAVVAIIAPPDKLHHYASLMALPQARAVVVAYDKEELTQDYLAQTIFGGNAACGVLPVTVKDAATGMVFRSGVGLRTPVTRLGYASPAEVGFAPDLLQRIDSVCRYGIQQRAFPGCQVLVARHGKVVVNRAYGTIAFDSPVKVDLHTLYDLASVSKATGTLSAVMKLVDDGKVKLTDKASHYVKGLRGTDKEDLTLTQLLYHETGLPPSLNMWQMMMDTATYRGKLIASGPTAVNTIKISNGAYGNKDAQLRTDILSRVPTHHFNVAIAQGIYGGKSTHDSVMQRIYHATLRPTKKYLYSCLNFCLLANVAERVSGTTLDRFTRDNVFAPLGAYHTMYRPLDHVPASQVAFTEVDTYLRRQHIHGYVHDELAAFSGGVQGNAGLFSNAGDLAKLFQMWLNGGTYGGERLLSPVTVSTFLSSKSPNSHRGLGFDKPVVGNPEASNTCSEATPETVGHTGFTGTCYWVDPANDMIYIFLSNRVCPTRDNPNFTRVSARSHINSIIYQSILH